MPKIIQILDVDAEGFKVRLSDGSTRRVDHSAATPHIGEELVVPTVADPKPESDTTESDSAEYGSLAWDARPEAGRHDAVHFDQPKPELPAEDSTEEPVATDPAQS